MEYIESLLHLDKVDFVETLIFHYPCQSIKKLSHTRKNMGGKVKSPIYFLLQLVVKQL